MAPAEIVKPSVNEGIVFPEAESGVAIASRPVDGLAMNIKGDTVGITIENSAFFGGIPPELRNNNAVTSVDPTGENVLLDPYGGTTNVLKFVRASAQNLEVDIPPHASDVGTVMCWLAIASTGSTLDILKTHNPLANVLNKIGYQLLSNALDTAGIAAQDRWQGSTTFTTTNATTAFSVDVWHHLAVTWSYSDSRMSIYVDGAREDQDALSDSTYHLMTYASIGWTQTLSNYFDGLMSDIRWHDQEIGEGDTSLVVPTGYLI